MATLSTQKRRVAAYVDGFNLYFGLKSKRYERYLWLDIHKLVRALLKDDQELGPVHYFTARVASPADKVKRQGTYLEALGTIPGLQIHYGKYEVAIRRCPLCAGRYPHPSEKQTDVNIAVQMLADAFGDQFDTALLVSGDSDLSPAVRAVRNLFASREVVCAFPPHRTSTVLRDAATSCFVIGRAKFALSQFPPDVTTSAGIRLSRPATWT